jgi:hypothetical protein
VALLRYIKKPLTIVRGTLQQSELWVLLTFGSFLKDAMEVNPAAMSLDEESQVREMFRT